MKAITLTALALALALPLALGACAGNQLSPAGNKDTAGSETPRQASFTRFPDLPMPVKADLDMGETLVFGTNDAWIGRLTINASHGSNDMFDFYKQEMPGFGWQEITSIRAKSSVMTYTRSGRVATIQIEDATLRGCLVTVTVSPQGAEDIPPPAVTAAPPPAQ